MSLDSWQYDYWTRFLSDTTILKERTAIIARSGRIALGATLLTIFGVSSAVGGDVSTVELDWYGYVKMDASYDQNPTSHGNFVMWLEPQPSGSSPNQFNMTHKQTRFGLRAKRDYSQSAKVGAQVAGRLEFDFYGGGGAENKAILQLRHAYFTVESGKFLLIAGQTHDLIAPLSPATVNYTVAWGSGNIGHRRPQVTLTYTADLSARTTIQIAGGLFRTIGNDLTPTLSLATEKSNGTDDGTDAAIPTAQGLLDLSVKTESGALFRLGVSSLYGRLKSRGTLGTIQTYRSKAVSGHLLVTFSNGFGFSGEWFSGDNLGTYQGGIGNANTFNGVSTKGGWASVWLRLNQQMELTTGFGVDDPDDLELRLGDRSKNQNIFGNIKFTPLAKFTVGVEVSRWKTDYLGLSASKSLRAQTAFIMDF